MPPQLVRKHPDDEDSSYDEVRLINIFLVKRGGCSFATKVKVASEKGAHAVIIYDYEHSKLSKKDWQNVVVQEDGFATDVHIPSVFISKKEGGYLVRAIKRSKTAIILELNWDVPTNHIVTTDLWMSSGSQESLKFLQNFAWERRVLNEVVRFQPHFAVFTGKDAGNVGRDSMGGLCYDNTFEFCAEDPDGEGPITGRMVLFEDVLQLCIHELHKVPLKPRKGSHPDAPLVEYSEKYWDYMERFPDRCALVARNQQEIQDGKVFGDKCSELLMEEVGISLARVAHCVSKSFQKRLKRELDHSAWSPRALRINGWRYSGILDAMLVTRAICAGFINQPRECHDLLTPRDPFAAYVPQQQAKGLSFTQVFLWLGSSVALCGVGSCYTGATSAGRCATH